METQVNQSQQRYEDVSNEELEKVRSLFRKFLEAKKAHKQFSQQNIKPEQDGSGME